jgi:hypothetical protein
MTLVIVSLGIGEILGDVALGIDHHGPSGGGVADEIAGVGQATQVVLLEEHSRSFDSS